jgi:hypothetical protein
MMRSYFAGSSLVHRMQAATTFMWVVIFRARRRHPYLAATDYGRDPAAGRTMARVGDCQYAPQWVAG